MPVQDIPSLDKETFCHKNNENIKAYGVTIPYTQEQLDEIEKCATDIIYFVENYVKIVTLDNGIQLFDLHDYQREWIKTCNENRFVMGKWSRQSGKCISPHATIRVRNKETGEEMTIEAEEFFNKVESSLV